MQTKQETDYFFIIKFFFPFSLFPFSGEESGDKLKHTYGTEKLQPHDGIV